jgi:hypothetical protein
MHDKHLILLTKCECRCLRVMEFRCKIIADSLVMSFKNCLLSTSHLNTFNSSLILLAAFAKISKNENFFASFYIHVTVHRNTG